MSDDRAHKRIDWSQIWYPGPRRAFTADEMARAGSDGPSATLLATAAINLASIAFVVLQLAPAAQTARLTAALVALMVMGGAMARWLWWRPWRKPLLQASLGAAAATVPLMLGLRWQLAEPADRRAVALTFGIGCGLLVTALLFLVLWRSQQIEARLREQAERERAIEMARRLAAAQIEPHFLFNTLASVQHWVQTRDDRAAPLLAALTGYLRATLPLFKSPLLAAGSELVAVQRYLEVMQARLGARLAFTLHVPAEVQRALLPPGLLLTLVENAVVHGIEPQLHGGRIELTGEVRAGTAHFVVCDNGAGPPADLREGIGLANIRQRMALAGGPGASLHLAAAPAGGCRAEIQLPYRTEP